MIVRELLTRLGFQVDEAGAAKYERRMDKVKNHMETLQNNLGGLLGAIGLGMAGSFFKDVTSQFTDLESRLANNLGADTAADSMARLNEVALLTYQPVQQVIDSFLSMKSALDPLGLTTEEQITLQQSINDGFTATGVKGEVAARAMMWLNRAFMKGSLSAEEINGLLESSDDLLQQFSEYAGVTNVEALKAMAKEGKLTSKMLVKFFQDSTDKFRQQSESMPITINDALSRIQGQFQYFVYEQDKVYGISQKLSALLMILADNIEVVAGMVAVVMIPALIGVAAWVATTIGAFAKLGLVLLASPITWVVLALGALALAIQDVYTWIQGGDSIIGGWLGPWENVLAQMTEDWDRFVAPIWSFSGNFGELMKAQDASTAWQELLDLLVDIWGIFWDTSLPGIILAIMPGFFDPVISAFQAAVVRVKEMWSEFWTGLKSGIASLPSEIMSGFKNGMNSLAGQDSLAGSVARGLGYGGERRTGGPVSAGTSYLVGEEGPEEFVPKRSGWILPHGFNQMAGKLGGLGASAPTGLMQSINLGGISLGLNMTMPEGTNEESAKAIVDMVRSELRSTLSDVVSSTFATFPETI